MAVETVSPSGAFNVTFALILNSSFAVGLNVPINGLDGLGVTLAPCHSTEGVRPSFKLSTSSSTVTRSPVKTFLSTLISLIVGRVNTVTVGDSIVNGGVVIVLPSCVFNVTSALIFNSPGVVGLNVPINGLDGLGVTLAPCHSTEAVKPSLSPSTSSPILTKSCTKTFFSTEIVIVGRA